MKFHDYSLCQILSHYAYTVVNSDIRMSNLTQVDQEAIIPLICTHF